ncbi:MAG: hypothetical protein KKD39_01625 [Candidatus Altiarchaeota archaeon]|nr:hypothetical protein [Candidatus Altiarchaeota archaeon]
MVEVDELVAKVVDASGKKVDEVRALMGEKRTRTHGLLSDYGAIYAVAKELGVELGEGEISISSIAQIRPRASVNVAGRVKTIYSVREFQRKDGSTGKLASAEIIDKTGETRVVLWDSNSSVIGKLRVGDILLVKNGFAKENQGRIEVHAGALTTTSINPENLKGEYPEIEERIDDVGALESGIPSINLLVRASRVYPKTEFTKKDGTTGYRASFIAEDKTGKARVVLWDTLADSTPEEGDIVRVDSAYTKEGLNGEVEIHCGSRARIEKSDVKLDLPPLPKTKQGLVKISEITGDMRGFDVNARVLRVYDARQYSGGTMQSMILGDDSGTIRIVFWNDKSADAAKINEGDALLVKNAYSKNNMNGEAEAHVGKYSEVVVDKDIAVPTVSEINKDVAKEKNISELDSSDSFVKIHGKIVSLEERAFIYMTCSECSKRVQNIGGEWMCEECGVIEAQPNMLASIVVEDKTGNIRAVAFKENAEKIMGFDVDDAMNIIGEAQDEKAPLQKAKEEVIGKEITLIGRVNYNDFSDQLEFIVNEVAD